MSKISKRPILCPSCGHTGEFTLWDSVNVDLDPEMREKEFSEALIDCFLIDLQTHGYIFESEAHEVPAPAFLHDKRNQGRLRIPQAVAGLAGKLISVPVLFRTKEMAHDAR